MPTAMISEEFVSAPKNTVGEVDIIMQQGCLQEFSIWYTHKENFNLSHVVTIEINITIEMQSVYQIAYFGHDNS